MTPRRGAIVRRLVGTDINVEVVATDLWQARMLLADRYHRDRAFLVGMRRTQTRPGVATA